MKRNPQLSTEIVLTMNMPIVHRLATRHAVEEGRHDAQQIRSYHQRLTKVFGGDYWQEIMWQQNATREQRETQLIEAYRNKLAQYMPYTGFCPVKEQEGSRTKYFIVFASRHADAMLLLNDAMLKAYSSRMHEASYRNTLFEGVDWRDMRTSRELEQIILETVKRNPNKTRKFIWTQIVKDHFMRYLESEYIAAVQQLVTKKLLMYINPRGTKRLNEDCILSLPTK